MKYVLFYASRGKFNRRALPEGTTEKGLSIELHIPDSVMLSPDRERLIKEALDRIIPNLSPEGVFKGSRQSGHVVAVEG